MAAKEIFDLIEKLTGQDCPLPKSVPENAAKLLAPGGGPGLGHSQFNELLLTLGYDRVTHAFFQYLVTGHDIEYVSGTGFSSLDAFREGVDRFRKLGMLLYGNVKYAFKTLSSNKEDLEEALSYLEKRDVASFKDRHQPVHPIERIPGDKTYYLGYLIERELRERLAKTPEDAAVRAEEKLRKSVIDSGRRNFEAYLVSDHLDVYVATSMRERHEYQMVHNLTHDIFAHPKLAELSLRYFDPTQAHCINRVDKGVAEALMLKRAKCTIYFAQESDTLGKDSELASTLAQGKPVIAYIPNPEEGYAVKLLDELHAAYRQKTRSTLLLEQLRLFEPRAAWEDAAIRSWIDDPATMDIGIATARLQVAIKKHYDGRTKMLCEDHPLGIQVNLSTGVANGVLVVRNVTDCAELVRRVVLRELEFDVEDRTEAGMKYAYLRERVSRCIFRVVTGDKFLTNAFWNFYLLEPVE